MYCVKCGRQCEKTQKRCPDCGMRLVTPAKLKELIELERITNMTFAGKFRLWRKRFKRKWTRRFGVVGEALGIFFSKLSVDFKALMLLIGRMLQAFGTAAWAFLKRAWAWLKVQAVRLWKRFMVWQKKARRKLAAKAAELKAQYTSEKESVRTQRETQQKTRAGAAPRPKGSTTARNSAAERTAAQKKAKPTAVSYAPRSPKSVKTSAAAKSKRDAGKPVRVASTAKNSKNRPVPKARKKSKRRQNPLKRIFTIEWAQEHLRSLVAMGLLLAALIVFAFWGAFSDSGQKTMAQIGLGSARGYLLIGDDYMSQSNYDRAVEYYYTSLTKDLSYDAALKLAIAYSYTGDVSREISALLLCTENYPENKLPFEQLYALYPEGRQRPARVQQAIDLGLKLYGKL